MVYTHPFLAMIALSSSRPVTILSACHIKILFSLTQCESTYTRRRRHVGGTSMLSAERRLLWRCRSGFPLTGQLMKGEPGAGYARMSNFPRSVINGSTFRAYARIHGDEDFAGVAPTRLYVKGLQLSYESRCFTLISLATSPLGYIGSVWITFHPSLSVREAVI